jgi:hypothetical protein
MAKQSAFGFSNNTDSAVPVVPKALGLVSNYAVTKDTAREATLNNKTAAIDREEIISYRSWNFPELDTNLNIQYPAPVRNAVCYQVTAEETLTTTDTEDADFRVDEPIIVSLQIRHPRSGNITNDIVGQAVLRLISACRFDAGGWRFGDLMRSAERPVED